MNSTPAITPIEKHVVLVGAGNAHLGFVRRFGMNPIPGVAVTLVSESAVIPYSAMVPGYVARDYSWDEITIDLVRLCQASHVRFLVGRVQSIDPIVRREVRFATRPPLTFDALSLGVGSLPACPESLAHDARSLTIRPMDRMTQQLDALEENLAKNPRPFQFVSSAAARSAASFRRRYANDSASTQHFM